MNLTRREVKGRYSQSLFGAGWAIAQPLATMAIFTLVFARLGKIPSGDAPYPLFAYAALVPWFFFSNSVASGTMSLITYRNIVTKTYFPREIVPLAQIGSRFVDIAAASALYVVLMAYYSVGVGRWVGRISDRLLAYLAERPAKPRSPVITASASMRSLADGGRYSVSWI